VAHYTIYGLRDPRDGRIRYIGCTLVQPAIRLAAHISASTCRGCGVIERRRAWLNDLHLVGVKPTLTVLESFDGDHEEASVAERFHIAAARAAGLDLTNGNAGGVGRRRSPDEMRAWRAAGSPRLKPYRYATARSEG
jgi:hypothetical protein